MIKITEKEIRSALQDNEVFQKLEPAQMMYVLITDIIDNGDMKKSNFEYWITQEDRWPEIPMEDRLDQVLRILDSKEIVRSLQSMQKSGFMHFCMPKCFPIKKLMDKKTFYSIIDHFDRLDRRTDDMPFKLALLMFSFDPQYTWETLKDAGVAREDRDWICYLINDYMEFLRLKNTKGLKRFVARRGTEFYFDMDDYAQSVLTITGIRDLKPLESRSFINRWIRNGVPLEMSDLDYTVEDALEAGAESDDEVHALRSLLLEHVLDRPEDNEKEILKSLVPKYSQKKIDRRIRQLEDTRGDI